MEENAALSSAISTSEMLDAVPTAGGFSESQSGAFTRPLTEEQNALRRQNLLESASVDDQTLSQLFEQLDEGLLEIDSDDAGNSDTIHQDVELLSLTGTDDVEGSLDEMENDRSGGSGGRSTLSFSGENAGTFLEGCNGSLWINRVAESGGGDALGFQLHVSGMPELGTDADYRILWVVNGVETQINSCDSNGNISLSLPAGASSGEIRIIALNDDIYDGDSQRIQRFEDGYFTIVSSSGYDISSYDEATFSIEDRVWGLFHICTSSAGSIQGGGYSIAGHAYWVIQIPDWDVLQEELDTQYTEIGLLENSPASYTRGFGLYWCAGNILDGYGELRASNESGGQGQVLSNASESHQVTVYSSSLMEGLLEFTNDKKLAGTTLSYALLSNNCVTTARDAAQTVLLNLPWHDPTGIPNNWSIAPTGLAQDIQSHEEECLVCRVPTPL